MRRGVTGCLLMVLFWASFAEARPQPSAGGARGVWIDIAPALAEEEALGLAVADLKQALSKRGSTEAVRVSLSLVEDAGQLHGEATFSVARQGRHWVLVGRQEEDLVDAVYWFLDRGFGVRWYDPFSETPFWQKKMPRLKNGSTEVSPAYRSREFFGEMPSDWRRRHYLRGKDAFTHHLSTLLSEAEYARAPESFAWVQGRRERPSARWGTVNAQPDFASEALVELLHEKINDFFARHPERSMISLGMNDSYVFGDSAGVLKATVPVRWFRGRPDFSNLVFGLIHRMALEMQSRHPGKRVGCLAYASAEQVPDFPIAVHVMPYLTADRSQWRDCRFREEDKVLMAAWAASGVGTFGLYDYYYGEPYVVPRVFHRRIAESLTYAASLGAQGFFAELLPVWPYDGAKAWLASQLLMDPGLDPEKLLEDFWLGCYGQAASEIAAFFRLCEEAWESQEAEARWLTYFRHPAQAEIFPQEMLVTLSAYLDLALTRRLSEEERERVLWLRDTFAVTRAFCELYQLWKEASQAALQTEADVERLTVALGEMKNAKGRLEEALARAEQHRRGLALSRRSVDAMLVFYPADELVWRLLRWGWAHGKSKKVVAGLRASAGEDRQGTGRILAALDAGYQVAGTRISRLQSAHFEGAQREFVSYPYYPRTVALGGWGLTLFPEEKGRVRVCPEAARGEGLGLRFESVMRADLKQRVPVQQGRHYWLGAAVRASLRGDALVMLGGVWVGAGGEVLGRVRPVFLPPHGERDWQEIGRVLSVPEGAVRLEIALEVKNLEPGEVCDVDAFEFYMLPGPVFPSGEK